MAEPVTHELWLDLKKETQLVPDAIEVRVGEGGTQVFKAHLEMDGAPYRVDEGWSATLRLLTGANVPKTQEAEIGGDGRDELTITLADEMLTDEGTCKLAYFALVGPDSETLTTEGFKLRILGSTMKEATGQSWDSRMERLIKEFEVEVAHIKAKEAERVANEEIRIENEKLRQKQEDRREKQERQRETAERKREQASQTAVRNAEAATETANTAANTATTAATHADEATEAAKEATQLAKDATQAAKNATSKSDEQTQLAKDATDAANAATRASEAQTGKADEATKRANDAAKAAEDGEAERVSEETKRKAAEAERQANEAVRKSSEQTRQSQEEDRKSAELLRAEADEARTKQQAANDAQQAKNNADQDANNKAAQGLVWVELTEEQLGPDRVPNIEGEFGKLYFAPSENPSQSDTAVEWMWKPGSDGTGRWERVGTSEVIPPSPIGTDKIDQIHDGEQLSGKGVMSEADLSYFFTLIKGDHDTHAAAQNVKDTAQDDAIKAAQKAGDDAASALSTFKKDQGETDKSQDEKIQAAQAAADAAAEAIPPTVTNEAGGILPAFPAEGGPYYPTAEGGELKGWLAIPVFAEGVAGLVPAAPSPDEGEKVLLTTGWGDYRGGGMPDYRALKASIAAAEKAKADTKVAGGGDYDFGTPVASQQALSNLESAIQAAQAVYDAYEDPATTQETLDAAQRAMDGAVETFTASVSPLQPDTSGLTEQERRYTSLKGSVVTSTDGKDVPFGDMWVTASEQQAADTALQAARTAVAAAKKQSEIASAVSTLDSALDTYEAARKTATKDTAALDRAIEAANTAKADVCTSDSEGSDLPSGSKYVTSAQMKALTDALSAAQSSKTSASTQAAIDKATSELTSATSTFNGQIKTNWSAPSTLDGASADDLARVCDLAKEDGDTYYQKYKGQTFTLAMQNTTYSAATITVRCDDAANMDAVGGGKCGLHFTIIQGLKIQQMNTSATTSGGYKGSNFYTKILPEIIKALPADIQSRLDNLYVDVNLASSGTTITPVEGKMHLVTMKQWFGQKNIDAQSWTSTCRAWWDKEEEWLKWNSEHDTNNDRIVKNDSGAAYYGWTASVHDSGNFGRVYNNGAPSSFSGAYISYVPVLGFSLTNNG